MKIKRKEGKKMTKQELIAKLEERKDLSERAYNTYQQLQGQLALLRDMLKDVNEKEKAVVVEKEKKDKGVTIPKAKSE